MRLVIGKLSLEEVHPLNLLNFRPLFFMKTKIVIVIYGRPGILDWGSVIYMIYALLSQLIL
jgi:hypothetical protein